MISKWFETKEGLKNGERFIAWNNKNDIVKKFNELEREKCALFAGNGCCPFSKGRPRDNMQFAKEIKSIVRMLTKGIPGECDKTLKKLQESQEITQRKLTELDNLIESEEVDNGGSN